MSGPQRRLDDWPFLADSGPRIVDGDGAWLIAEIIKKEKEK